MFRSACGSPIGIFWGEDGGLVENDVQMSTVVRQWHTISVRSRRTRRPRAVQYYSKAHLPDPPHCPHFSLCLPRPTHDVHATVWKPLFKHVRQWYVPPFRLPYMRHWTIGQSILAVPSPSQVSHSTLTVRSPLHTGQRLVPASPLSGRFHIDIVSRLEWYETADWNWRNGPTNLNQGSRLQKQGYIRAVGSWYLGQRDLRSFILHKNRSRDLRLSGELGKREGVIQNTYHPPSWVKVTGDSILWP